MVKLEEVVDEEFLRDQEGPDDEDWDTDSGTSCMPLIQFHKPKKSY